MTVKSLATGAAVVAATGAAAAGVTSIAAVTPGVQPVVFGGWKLPRSSAMTLLQAASAH